LYQRIKKHTNPGKDLLQSIYADNEIEKIIKEYGDI